MRTLGIDFGLKRVGLALTDPRGSMAFPYKTIVRTTREGFFAEIVAILEREDVEAIVIGLPLTLSGEDSMTTRQVRNFAASLGRRTELPITLMDERLSSFAAAQDLAEAGITHGKRLKAALDQQAAVRILQTWFQQKQDAAP